MIAEWIGIAYMSGSYPRFDKKLVMKYPTASDTMIYKKKKSIISKQRAVSARGSLTAIQRKIKASIENVNDAASQVDMRRTRK